MMGWTSLSHISGFQHAEGQCNFNLKTELSLGTVNDPRTPFLVVVLLGSIPNDRCGGGGLARFRVELESVELIRSENVDDDVS